MQKFEFYSAPRIVFGRGQFARVAELAAPLGTAALVVHSVSDTTLSALAAKLSEVRLTSIPFRQKGEPTTEDVDKAVEAARASGCDMVIAIGGGSAIDCAKAVAGLLTNRGTALDYMEIVGKGHKITVAAAPWIAIPCTAGTGAEVTRNAVIGYLGGGERNFKASIRSELLLPRVALIDPELGVDVKPAVTAASGMDALCQCIEAYTSTGANPMTDALALEGVRRAARSLRRAYEHPADLDAREDMALAALLSGLALTSAGLGAVHGFAAPLGAHFPVPHGVVCATLLPHVMAANVAVLRSSNQGALSRYAAVGRAMTGAAFEDAAAVQAAMDGVAALVRDLAIPRLGQFSIHHHDVPAMVELAKKSSSMRYNPVKLTDESLKTILSAAL